MLHFAVNSAPTLKAATSGTVTGSGGALVLSTWSLTAGQLAWYDRAYSVVNYGHLTAENFDYFVKDKVDTLSYRLADFVVTLGYNARVVFLVDKELPGVAGQQPCPVAWKTIPQGRHTYYGTGNGFLQVSINGGTATYTICYYVDVKKGESVTIASGGIDSKKIVFVQPTPLTLGKYYQRVLADEAPLNMWSYKKINRKVPEPLLTGYEVTFLFYFVSSTPPAL